MFDFETSSFKYDDEISSDDSYVYPSSDEDDSNETDFDYTKTTLPYENCKYIDLTLIIYNTL